jgi:hypothetical protein
MILVLCFGEGMGGDSNTPSSTAGYGILADVTGGSAVNSQTALAFPAIDESTAIQTAMTIAGSFRLRNVTPLSSCGGVVRILKFNGGVELSNAPTLAQYDAVYEAVISNPRTRVFGGSELLHCRQWDSSPSTPVPDFAQFNNAAYDVATAADTGRNPSMGCFVVVFEPTTASQSYNMTARADILLRFSTSTITSHLAVHSPTTTADFLNKARDAVEWLGANGRAIVDTAMAAGDAFRAVRAIGPRVSMPAIMVD